MASMTGAPKLRAMQLIDAMEDQKRGLYSGTLGFFAPDGTADLNVVIRTILFDRTTGGLSLTTGSALTALCDPTKELEECEVKARSVLNVLRNVG
jgi:para-aminobenzoate synthetase component 1